MTDLDEWESWLDDWTLALADDQKRGGQTATVYLRGARQFVAFLREAYPDVSSPGKATKRHVEAWLGHLARAGKAASTRRVRLMGLSALFRWVAAEPGSLVTAATLPTAGVVAPEVLLPDIDVPEESALRAVLATCEGSAAFIDLRDTAILRLMLSTGMRRGELVSLDLGDVDSRGEVQVLGKGAKPRVVSLSGSKVQLALSRYLRARRRRPLGGETALFVSIRPSARGAYRLSGGAIGEMLVRRCKRAGVERIHPHQLRHRWAHTAKSRGLSEENMERMAGWAPGSAMARRYGRSLADQRARDAHRDLRLGDEF